MNDSPVVLFLCIHNSGRSLAAKVLLHHYARGRVDVRSAGSEPGNQLNPSVVAVLEERGLDPSREFPKPLTDADAKDADVVVTMGCGDMCPYYPGKRYLDWELQDPAGLPIDDVRPIVDEIDRRVRSLLTELLHEAPLGVPPHLVHRTLDRDALSRTGQQAPEERGGLDTPEGNDSPANCQLEEPAIADSCPAPFTTEDTAVTPSDALLSGSALAAPGAEFLERATPPRRTRRAL